MATIELHSHLPRGYREQKDNWTGITSTAERRKRQNRLNQRILRERRAAQKIAAADNSGSTSEYSLALATRLDRATLLDAGEEGRLVRSSTVEDSSTLYSLEADHLLVLQPLLSSPKLRSVWRYGVNIMWPGSDPRPSSHEDGWTWSLFRHCTHNPLLFHSLSWAMSNGVDLYKIHSDSNQILGLYHQSIAIRLLKERLERNEGSILSDELTLAIALLMQGRELPQWEAANRSGKLYGAFRPLLQHLQWLSCVGGTEKVAVHKEMLRRAIDARGGLAKMTIPNMAEWLQYHDIADASYVIGRPYFELCQSYQLVLTVEVPRLRQNHQSRSRSSFAFDVLGLDTSFKDLLRDICAYVELVELYCARVSGFFDLAQLATYRNLIQYRLLSLQFGSKHDRKQELCCLGALIFSYGVVYPLPNRRPLSALTTQLKTDLRSLEISTMPPDFLLWLNMLGAMSAAGTTEENWFMINLALLSDEIGLSAWCDVCEIMRQYLWSDQACGVGGLDVWQRSIVEEESRKRNPSLLP